jgi:tetratricopeptide (TPR) repeat protein
VSAAEPPGDDAASIEAFRRLIESASAQATTEGPVLLTDRLVGPVAGDLLRRCAVPHDFDCELLAWIGGIGPDEAEQRYAQFTDLSLIEVSETSLRVHESWREPLWRWWLADAQRERFVALSERLVEWFTRPASPTGEDPNARRRMFHLLGCRRDEGMAEFDRLFRTARHRRRFSECSLLLQLIREYDPVLTPEERVLLSYHEGKIASDLRQWERALPILRSVSDDPRAGPQLRINAEARMGNALRQLNRTDEARALLEGALGRVAGDPMAERSRWRVLYELGEMDRDLGYVDRAAATLAEALARANDDEEEADFAGVLNSLGTVQLRRRDIDAALTSFNASLDHLRRRGDVLRPGTVLNNVGLAQLERCDWPAAEAAFAGSLETKRSAGDVLGQATTLVNLGRAQAAQARIAEALKSVEEAERLFERGGDPRGRARAQQARQQLAQRNAGAGTPQQLLSRTQVKRLPRWARLLIVLGVLLLAMIVLLYLLDLLPAETSPPHHTSPSSDGA